MCERLPSVALKSTQCYTVFCYCTGERLRQCVHTEVRHLDSTYLSYQPNIPLRLTRGTKPRASLTVTPTPRERGDVKRNGLSQLVLLNVCREALVIQGQHWINSLCWLIGLPEFHSVSVKVVGLNVTVHTVSKVNVWSFPFLEYTNSI